MATQAMWTHGHSAMIFALEQDINAFDLPNQEVFFGVRISAMFNFTDPASVTLYSAGVDFKI